MFVLSSPFRNSYSSILFVNGFIHLIMLGTFAAMYMDNEKKEYMYVVIVFSFTSLTLILSSVLNIQLNIGYSEI